MKHIIQLKNILFALLEWMRITLILLGIVYTYQFTKLNWYGSSTSYQVEVLQGMIQQEVERMLTTK